MERTRSRPPLIFGLGESVADYLVIGGVLALSLAVPQARAGLMAALAFGALVSPSLALRALALTWMMTVLNPGIVGDGLAGGSLRYAVIFSVFAAALFRGIWISRGLVPRLVVSTIAFPAYAALAAVVVSYAVDVSLLKVASYCVGVIGMLWSVYLLDDSPRFERWLLRLVVVIVFASFPLIVSGVGYFRNGSGFQGILTHPQFYGAFLGVVLSWLFVLRFVEHDRSRLLLATIVVGSISLIATEARVGVATLIGSVTFVSLFFAPSGAQRSRARNVFLVATTVILLLLIIFPAVGEAIYQFAIKEGRGNPRDIAESLEQSRGQLIFTSFMNFLDHPLLGIGFGLPSDPARMVVQYDPVLGLPASVPVEKGFIVTALLEETGVIGTALFTLFMIAIIRRALWSRRSALIALAFAVPLSNIAEVTMFSLGGNGLFFWVLLSFAAYSVRATRGAEPDQPQAQARDAQHTAGGAVQDAAAPLAPPDPA